MKTTAAILFMLMLCLRATAAGMSDYTFKIDETHSVFRMNAGDIMVGRTDGSLYDKFCGDRSASGPLREIYGDDNFIFLKHIGRKQRKAFPGDTYLEADDTTNVYYTLKRHADAIAGPFDLNAFSNHLTRLGHSANIPWRPLSEARRESFRHNPLQAGVWQRMFLVIGQLPGTLFVCVVCYIIISGPLVISAVIIRKAKGKKWNVEKWWKWGLFGVGCLVIAMTVVCAVEYAYM